MLADEDHGLIADAPGTVARLRRGRFADLLAEEGLDIAVLWHQPTVCYFTGNEIAAGALLVVERGGGAVVVCDDYDAHNFRTADPGLEVRPAGYGTALLPILTEELAARPDAVVGVETAGLPYRDMDGLRIALRPRVPVPVDRLVGRLRLVKSATEVGHIRAAARAVESAYRTAGYLLRTSTTERELAAAVYVELLRRGSEHVASQPYVKSGPRALLTHARWTDRTIGPDDHVLLEFGGSVHRYHAALMRTRLAADPSADYRRAVRGVLAGRDAYLEATRPGITAAGLHERYLDALRAHGVQGWNRHASGYSLGIAFPPYWGEVTLLTVAHGSDVVLEEGMVLHLISGLTQPSEAVPHVGLSECVLVTATGVERLVQLPDFL